MVDDRDLAAAVAAAVERLPERQRVVFLAVRDEGASYRQLAVRRGIGEAEVEQAFAQALTALVRAVDG